MAGLRNDPEMKSYFDFAFGRQPAEELYELSTDPHQMRNVAEDPRHREAKAELAGRLHDILTQTKDPRVTQDQPVFERPPFSGALR